MDPVYGPPTKNRKAHLRAVLPAAGTTSSPQTEATGLGLAIAKRSRAATAARI